MHFNWSLFLFSLLVIYCSAESNETTITTTAEVSSAATLTSTTTVTSDTSTQSSATTTTSDTSTQSSATTTTASPEQTTVTQTTANVDTTAHSNRSNMNKGSLIFVQKIQL